jgi:hypothetical protein
MFLLLLPAAIFSGCLNVQTTVKVNKDGSGTINEKVLFSGEFAGMIKEFAMSFGDSTQPQEEFSLFKEDELKAMATNYGEGVRYLSSEKISDNEWEGYTAVYEFDDISKIKLQPEAEDKVSLGMAGGDQSAAGGEEKDYYFFSFVKGNEPELIIDRPDIEIDSQNVTQVEESSESEEQSNSNEGDEYLHFMKNMSINVNVEVDGKIINTNASYVEGSKITLLQMNFGEMMKNKEMFNQFKNKQPKSIEEMKEYLEALPGMKLEIQKPVTVKFK